MENNKMSIRVILKSGNEFTVKCDSFSVKRNGLNQITQIDAKGIVENKFLHLEMDEIAAIVRVYSDEDKDEI